MSSENGPREREEIPYKLCDDADGVRKAREFCS
jgi:hypothetical protein